MNRRVVRACLGVFAAVLIFAGVVLAGPPLICHPFDIGAAKSLPWISHGWNLTGAESYDVKGLVADTLAILDSDSTVIVHMETLRRATLFARKDPVVAKELLTKLVVRAEKASHPDALALFDAGYLAEAYKQWMSKGEPNPAKGLDGYALVKKAIQTRGNDAQMEFAAALIKLEGPAGDRQEHARKAIEGAKTDALLARNLSLRFLGPQSQTLAEMLSTSAVAKDSKP